MKKVKVLKVIIIICLILLAGLGITAGIYLKQQWDRTNYFENTTINGYDVSEMEPQDVLGLLVADYSAPKVMLMEKGEEAMSASLAELGYEVDQEALLQGLQDALKRQKTSVTVLVESLMNGNSFQVPVLFSFDEEKFVSAVNSGALQEERIVSVDAQMRYDAANKNYYMEPEIYGTEFEDGDLQQIVKEQVDSLVANAYPQQDLTIDIPESIYIKPQVTQDDVELNNLCNLYNQYDKAKITYLFGEEKVVVDWDTIQNWLIIEDGDARLDEESIYNYVISLAAKYDTRYYDRKFHTSLGTDIVIPSSENDYGYTIYQDGEFSQLVSDIKGNAQVEREPVYFSTDGNYGNPVYYRRNGTDDLAGTYVEVNLTRQHLWFYKDGELIVESDLVSGSVAKKSETKTGVFPLAYKESPSILRGAEAANGYETEVKYWMPFYDGQGLHDADWRSAFGGNIYQTNGSHGCVNLPPETARKIYENIEAGVAIILYK